MDSISAQHLTYDHRHFWRRECRHFTTMGTQIMPGEGGDGGFDCNDVEPTVDSF